MRGSRVVRFADESKAAEQLQVQATSGAAASLQIQTDMVDRGVRFDQLAATQELNLELEHLLQRQAAEKQRLLEQQQEAERAEHQKRLDMQRKAEAQARQARCEHHQNIRKYCALKRPFGTCDKSGCTSRLKDWTTVYRKYDLPCRIQHTLTRSIDCCSCNSNDNFWHCPRCGNDCGHDEHPYMLELDCSDSCLVM